MSNCITETEFNAATAQGKDDYYAVADRWQYYKEGAGC